VSLNSRTLSLSPQRSENGHYWAVAYDLIVHMSTYYIERGERHRSVVKNRISAEHALVCTYRNLSAQLYTYSTVRSIFKPLTLLMCEDVFSSLSDCCSGGSCSCAALDQSFKDVCPRAPTSSAHGIQAYRHRLYIWTCSLAVLITMSNCESKACRGVRSARHTGSWTLFRLYWVVK